MSIPYGPGVALIGALACASATSAAEDALKAASEEQKAAWGQSVFIRDCLACHTVEPENKYGPHLHRLVGRNVGAADGFKYSAALSRLGEENVVWNDETLRGFFSNPQHFAPGARMWVSIPDDEVVEVLISYFRSIRED